MKVGDVSRRRRLADPVRLRWYAHHRAVRFAQRMARAAGLACSARVCQRLHLKQDRDQPLSETAVACALPV
jgi:hypothetical protein